MKKSKAPKIVSIAEIEKAKTEILSNKEIAEELKELVVYVLTTFLFISQKLSSNKITISILRKLF